MAIRKFGVLGLAVGFALAGAAPAQVQFVNENGFESLIYFSMPSSGTNVAGTGSLTFTTDQGFQKTIPREVFYWNDDPLGPNALTGEVAGHSYVHAYTYWADPLLHTAGHSPVIHDWFIYPAATSANGERYADDTQAALLVVLGGDPGFPPPAGGAISGNCPFPAIDGYLVDDVFTTGTGPNGGFLFTADGNTDYIQVTVIPGGMEFDDGSGFPLANPDPALCELGGNYTWQWGESFSVGGPLPNGGEYLPAGVTANNRSPFGAVWDGTLAGLYGPGNVGFASDARTDANFDDTFVTNVLLVPEFDPGDPANPGSFFATEQGTGAMHPDLTGLGAVNLGFVTKTPASDVGATAFVLVSIGGTFGTTGTPSGLAVTPTSSLLILPNLADPNFMFSLSATFSPSPLFNMDTTIVASGPGGEARTPKLFLPGPLPGPITFWLQSAVIDSGFTYIKSSNALQITAH